jgi:hypothetical protein
MVISLDPRKYTYAKAHRDRFIMNAKKFEYVVNCIFRKYLGINISPKECRLRRIPGFAFLRKSHESFYHDPQRQSNERYQYSANDYGKHIVHDSRWWGEPTDNSLYAACLSIKLGMVACHCVDNANPRNIWKEKWASDIKKMKHIYKRWR